MKKFEQFQNRFDALTLVKNEVKALEANLLFKDGIYHSISRKPSRCAQKRGFGDIKQVNVYDALPLICKICVSDGHLLSFNSGLTHFLLFAESAEKLLVRQASLSISDVKYSEEVSAIGREKEDNYRDVCSYLGGGGFDGYADSKNTAFEILAALQEQINKNFYALPEKLREYFQDENNDFIFLENLAKQLLCTDTFIEDYSELKVLKAEMFKAQKVLAKNSKRIIISVFVCGDDPRLRAYLSKYHIGDGIFANLPKLVYDYMKERVEDFSYSEILILPKPLENDILENFISLRKSFPDKTFKEVLKIAKTV